MEFTIEFIEEYNEFLKKEGYVPTIDMLIQHLKVTQAEAEATEESDLYDSNTRHNV